MGSPSLEYTAKMAGELIFMPRATQMDMVIGNPKAEGRPTTIRVHIQPFAVKVGIQQQVRELYIELHVEKL